MQRHILTLLAILTLVAITSGFNHDPIGPRGEALDAFLETLPGPILLGEKSSRSFVFINAADHPHLLIEFARRNGLPEDLMAQVFELPDQGSVPTGLTNAILVSEERLFEPADRTLIAITPIALNGDRTEALFGTIYDVPNETRLALDGEFDVIVHGCNCQCTMGAGIAKFIKATFPEAYQADLETNKGDRTKLGSYSSATVQRNGHEITIVNAYTQFHYRGKKPLVEYDALASVFTRIANDFAGKRIGYPKIGAGLAGGDWDHIAGLIAQALSGQDYTVVEFG